MVKILLVLVSLSIVSIGMAQPATPEQKAGLTNTDGFGILHFQTRLGSFRMIDGKGRTEFSFKGTVLISRLKGRSSFTGQIRKEFEKGDRVVYHGTGRFSIVGEWRSIQWFGSDLSGYWFGFGVMRMAGEFDREQKTGEYWFEDPTNLQFWRTGGTMDVYLPEKRPGYNPTVKVKPKK